MRDKLRKAGNALISLFAGIASFTFSFWALMVLRTLDEKLLASLALGLFALLICWIAAERPNSEQGRAVTALVKRLLAVRTGDFQTPAPASVRKTMPNLADAVDTLFEQVRLNLDHVRSLALYDPVTSLPNRVHFKRDGEALLARRQADEKAAMLFIDLDGFKDVNDNLGHAKGDQVLVMVADRLREVVKAHMPAEGTSGPVIARLAGDEFTLLFPAVPDTAAAEQIGSAVLASLSEPFIAGSQSVHIGASIGISIYPDHAADLPSLMKAADIAMYHAKASGRSRLCVYDEPLAVAFAARAETERALRSALRRNEFSLAFQPQLCARSGLPVGGEALLRWTHPEDGLRLPDTFIPIAEESSLILGIGDWVVDAMAETLVRWEAAGMTHRIAFNVSPRQIERAGFFSRLRETVAASGARLSLLELEFTETMAMRCTDTIIAELAALRADGVAITIDDFGSGYSNLSRIKDMPLDRVKLDRSLIQDVDISDSARTIVASVIHLIQGLGLEVVAEGVERQAQLDVLRAIGCDTFQGFAFAGAMPEAEFIGWVGDRERSLLPQTA